VNGDNKSISKQVYARQGSNLAEAKKNRQERINEPPKTIGESVNKPRGEPGNRTEELEVVFNTITEPILIYDADGVIRRANQAAVEIYGLNPIGMDRAELAKRNNIRRPDGKGVAVDELPSTRALRGETISHERFVFTNASGRELTVEASVSPFFSNGKIIGAVAVWHDITRLENALEEVRESRSQVLDILESISDGFFALDSLWRFTYINGRAQKLLGLRKEDVLFKGIWDKLPNAQVLRLFKELSRVAEEQVTASFEEFLPSVGRWFEFRVYPYENGISVYFSDVTEHKQAEEELKKNERKYRTLFDAIDEGFCIIEVIFDENEKPIDYRFLEINPAFERQTGLIDAEGKRMRELAPLHEEHWFEVYGRIALTGEPARFENPAAQLGRWYDVYAFRVGQPEERQVAVLFNDITERKRAEQEREYALQTSNLLLKAADTLALSINLQETLDALADILIEVTGRHRVVVSLYDKDTDELVITSSRGRETLPVGMRVEIARLAPQVRESIVEKRPVVVDYNAPDMPEENKRRAESLNTKLSLSAPLVLGSEIVGHIGLDEPGERREFTERELDLIEGIASQAAVVLENARLYEKTAARARTFEAVNQMGRLLNSTFSMEDTFSQIADYATLLLGMPSSVLLVLDKESWEFRVAAAEGVSSELIHKTITLNEAKTIGLGRMDIQALGDLSTLSAIPFFADSIKQGFTSALVSTLFIENEPRALLVLPDKKRILPSEEDLSALSIFTNQAATAIRNAERHEAERHIADTLQASILVMPERVEGIEYGYLYRSATETARVGGDFFDIFELEHDKIGIVIGDVSGKGIEATALTTVVKNTIKAHTYEDGTPAIIMSKTNDLVTRVSPLGSFVTVFFAMLDKKTGKLTYCNAGHPPALIKRTSGAMDMLAKGSPIIGVFSGMHYRSGKGKLEKGDILVLYTDGIIEARCSSGIYGEERLVEFLKSLEPISVKDVPQMIFNDALRCAHGKLSDDIALLTVSLKGDINA